MQSCQEDHIVSILGILLIISNTMLNILELALKVIDIILRAKIKTDKNRPPLFIGRVEDHITI
jgi:hypothetical protein